MSKLKQLQSKLTAIRVALGMAVLALVGIGGFTYAYSNNSNTQPTTVIENAASVTVNQAQTPESPEPFIGAMATDLSVSNLLNVNGDLTYYLSQEIDASTTIASFPDPFRMSTSSVSGEVVISELVNGIGQTGATSTVELVKINIIGVATTTFEVDCTASNNPGTTSTPAILDTEALIVTSTKGIIESGMTSSTNPGLGSMVLSDTTEIGGIKSLIKKILLTPQKPYLVCKVWQPFGDSLNTFTNSVNSAKLKVSVRITRPQE